MLSSQDLIHHDTHWFNGAKYLQKQSDAIKKRLAQFKSRLYLEIGGKFLYDPHAARVLPGFHADSKKQIFAKLLSDTEIIFCINAKDLQSNRQLSSEDIDYKTYCLSMLDEIRLTLDIRPLISINRVSEKTLNIAKDFHKKVKILGLKSLFFFLKIKKQNLLKRK